MNTGDCGVGGDKISLASMLDVHETAQHRTAWRIHRFDEEVFLKRVKQIWDRAAEFLILADYWIARGNLAEAARKRLFADKLISDGEALAYSASLIDGNILLNEGINAIWTLSCGGSETAFNNANARLGVGDSAAAEAATQTDLQAGSNKLYKAMDVGYPTFGTLQKGTWKATFGSAEANYAWNEFSVDNGAAALKNLNRKVSAQGTKTAGQTWALTLDITIS